MRRTLPLRFVISCVALVLFSATAFAQFERDPAAVGAYNRGVEALAQEQWAAAQEAFSQATNVDPTYGEAFSGAGDALRELKDYQGAITQYRKALDIPGDHHAMAYNGVGVCYRELAQIELAFSSFDSARELDPRNADILANYGDILINYSNDPVRALTILDDAIELDDQNAKNYLNRGWAKTQMREFDDAVVDLNRAIELDPEDHEIYQRLSSVYLFQEMYEPAIEALSQAIDHYEPEESGDPSIYLTGLLQRSSALLELGKLPATPDADRPGYYELAIADSDTILAEYPDRVPESGLALYRKGVSCRLLEKFSEAIIALTDAIELVPAGADSTYLSEAYLKRGICWHYQQQESLARGDFLQSAAINFNDPLPHLWIGYTYADEEDYRQAIESYSEAIAKSPSFALAYINRGMAYVQMGENRKAIENFNEAIRNDPSNPKHLHKRGVIHLTMGKQLSERGEDQGALVEYQRAFDSFNMASIRDENYAAAFRAAGDALRAMGRDSLAETYDTKAAALEAAE